MVNCRKIHIRNMYNNLGTASQNLTQANCFKKLKDDGLNTILSLDMEL